MVKDSPKQFEIVRNTPQAANCDLKFEEEKLNP